MVGRSVCVHSTMRHFGCGRPFVSGRENGTGLGLALVSKLINDGGGWITVDSVPGHTVFRVSLPRAESKDT